MLQDLNMRALPVDRLIAPDPVMRREKMTRGGGLLATTEQLVKMIEELLMRDKSTSITILGYPEK